MANWTKRRTWTVSLDGRTRDVIVEYASLSGWMTIMVDDERLSRAWREWQTVFGGAMVSGELDGHRIEARVTQRFGTQEYSFALFVDGRLEPGSDALPEPSTLRRSTLRGAAALVFVIFVVTLVTSQLRRW